MRAKSARDVCTSSATRMSDMSGKSKRAWIVVKATIVPAVITPPPASPPRDRSKPDAR